MHFLVAFALKIHVQLDFSLVSKIDLASPSRAQCGDGGEHAEQYIWQGYALLQQWTDTTDAGQRRETERARGRVRIAKRPHKNPKSREMGTR